MTMNSEDLQIAIEKEALKEEKRKKQLDKHKPMYKNKTHYKDHLIPSDDLPFKHLIKIIAS